MSDNTLLVLGVLLIFLVGVVLGVFISEAYSLMPPVKGVTR